MPVNRITKFTFNGDLDFRNKIMSLDTAKHILAHLSAVTGKTIQFSNDMWALIEDDDEAIEILEEAYSRGWNSNEPDIIITAASGYNGIVKVNGSDFQLTETSTGSGVWINSNAVTITSLSSFLERDSRHALNDTAQYIKTVRFGKNANTSSCTTLFRFASSYTTNTALLSKLDLRHLDTSNVTIIQGAFSGISEGSVEHIGIEDFDVRNVTDFRYCFNGALALGDIDLHKWHTASGAYTLSFLTSAQTCAEVGVNQKIYYTPAYWGLELLDTSYQQLTVYPYHDITVASSLTSGQKIYINGSAKNMSYDSSLGIWYYDIEGTVDTMESMFRQDSSFNPTASSVISVSFGSNIGSKINYANVSSDSFLFAWKATATNIRSVDFTSLAKALNDNLNIVPIRQMFIYNAKESGHGTNLVNIYGLDQITKQIDVGHSFRGCESLRYIDLGTTDYASNGFKLSFYYNTNLIRIKSLPGMPEGCNTTNVFTGCSALTTIDAAGPISESIDFSPCPLSLASAKVILSALQTVESETITFSNTTVGYINSDGEATHLAYLASLRGWNLPNVNTYTFYNIKGYSFDAAYSIDDTDCIESGYCYSSTNSTPDIVNDDYEVGTVSDSILTAHIYKESEYWNASDVSANCDGTVYTEPDGSTWMRVSHQENPANASNNGLFSNGQRAHYYKINENAWINFEMDRYIFSSNNGGHEYMCKQKSLSTDTETKFRWIQTDSGCRCTYDDVDVDNITKIETAGYDQSASTVGGIWAQFESSNLASNNRTRTNSWGRVMQWTRHNSGLAGYNNTLVTTGYSDYYVRIDNTYFGLQNDTQYYVRAYVKHSDNTITYYPVETVTTNDLWYQQGGVESTDITDTAERGINRIGITVTAQNKESRIVNIINAYSTTSSVSFGGSSKSNLNNAGPMVYTDTTTTASGYSTSLTAGTTYYFSNYIVNEVGLWRNAVHSYKTKALPSLSGFAIADVYTDGGSAASDTNVCIDFKFTITNADAVTITNAGIVRGTTSNPTSGIVVRTTTTAGAKTASVTSNNYNTTLYYRPFITYTNDAGTATNIFGSQLTKTSHVVLSRKSATGTSGSCSVRTNGTSATNIYVNNAVRFFPTSTYNKSSYTLSWELRRSSTTGTVIASGTVNYYSSGTAFVNHANHNMSNANSTSYTHYLIFWRTGDTSHKVYYVSDSEFAEKSTSAWYTFHYSGKSYT